MGEDLEYEYKVLLADDDPDRLGAWGRVLGKAGFKVITARDARSAYETAAAGRPDLVLSGVLMPEGGGPELCRLIRADAELAETPVVLFSGMRKGSESAAEGLKAGADDYLETPVDTALLVAKVARHAERGAAARERTRLEAELRREAGLLRALMESLPDAVYFKDREGRFVRANRHVPFRGGPSEPEGVLGKTDFDLFEEGHARRAREDELRVMETGEPLVDREEREDYPDGSSCWLSTTKAPVYDDEGRVTGIVGVSRDISRRKAAEEALARSEEHFRTLIEGATDLVSVLDTDGTALYESPSAERILGYRPEELVGRNVFALVHEEDRATLAAVFAEALARETLTEPFKYRFLCKDGSWRTLESVGRRVFDRGRGHDVGVVNTRDVTERERLSEELACQRRRLDDLVENVPGIVWETRFDRGAGGQRVEYVSEQVESLLGYPREEWASAPDFWLSVVHPEDRGRAEAESRALVEGGAERGAVEYRNVTKSGGEVWVEARMSVAREGGAVVGLRGITTDVTARKEAERERERLIAELREALAEVKTLRGIISVCSYCRKVRVEENSWEQLESYVSRHSEAQFSHSFCPDCYRKEVEPMLEDFKRAVKKSEE